MHTFIACVITAVLAFAAGEIYGHRLASLAHAAAQLAHEKATQELKALRGEIINLGWRKGGQ